MKPVLVVGKGYRACVETRFSWLEIKRDHDPLQNSGVSIFAESPVRESAELAGTVKLSRICPFCGRILLDQRLRINDLAVAAGGENAAKLLNLTVPVEAIKR